MAESVKVLRELLNDPEVRSACNIPEDAEIDEAAFRELELWCDEKIDPLNLPTKPFIDLSDHATRSN